MNFKAPDHFGRELLYIYVNHAAFRKFEEQTLQRECKFNAFLGM